MSRSFSIALIIVGSTMLGSFLWLHIYLVKDAHADTLNRMHDLNQLVIEQKSNSLSWQYQATRDFFSDWSKTRFNKILHVWEKGDKAQKEIAKLSNRQNWSTDKFSDYSSIHKYQILREAMLLELREVVAEITVVYTGDAKAFDFSEKMLKNRLAYIEEIYQNAVNKTHPKKIGPQDNEVDFLTLTALVYLEKLLQSASNFYTGCGITFDNYFPVMIDRYENTRLGETVNTRIAIGTFTTAFNPDNVVIVTNGDTLRVCEDGLADFAFKPRRRGKHSLKLECLVTNPLTGEVQRGESRINLRVH